MTVHTPTNMQLDPESFRAIADFAYRESGLTLVEEKATMIQSRLRQRIRALDLPGFPEYCAFIGSENGKGERRHLISALTTNVSHFFREAHHFETLTQALDAQLSALKNGKQMRIWSAGSSNGQEAVSCAMALLEHAPEVAALDLRILGTDIDSKVVAFARKGIYPERLMSGVSDDLRQKYFTQVPGDGGETHYEVAPAVRGMIRFNELNLLSKWPMTRPFDVIFCRNVVIYFDAETQAGLWPRFRQVLKPDGVLFLGHSERIADPARFGFTANGPTTYYPRA